MQYPLVDIADCLGVHIVRLIPAISPHLACLLPAENRSTFPCRPGYDKVQPISKQVNVNIVKCAAIEGCALYN